MSEFGIDREDQETRLRVAALLVAINVPIYTAIFKGWLWVGWSVMAASLTVWIVFVMFRTQQSVSQGGRPNRL